MKKYPSVENLRRAVVLREQLDNINTELEALFEGTTSKEVVELPLLVRSKMTPETRAKIAAKQKANWAERRLKLGEVEGEVEGEEPTKSAAKPGPTKIGFDSRARQQQVNGRGAALVTA